MPTLLKRSNGIYYIVYRDNGTARWKSTGQRLKPLALRALVDFKSTLSQPRLKVTLSQFEKDFLSYASTTYSQRTVDIYRRVLANLRGITGDVWVSSINTRHIDEYKVKRLKQVSPVSVNIELRTLRAAFYTAQRWMLLSENPFKKVQLLRIVDQHPTYVSREDFQKLLSVVSDSWFRDLLIVAVSTGLRRAEVVNLTWKDVDSDRRLLHIHSKENFRTKWGRRRSVPMTDTVYHLLLRKVNTSCDDYLFTMRGVKVPDDLVTHKFKAYVRKAGLNDKLHFHSLRHTFATWLVQEGVPIYEVQKLLGHSNISVTEVYSHLGSSELHSAVNKLRVGVSSWGADA